MINNCSDEFNQFHENRYSKMSVEELISEYDAICDVLNLDSSPNLPFIDELLCLRSLIEDRCVVLVKELLIIGHS